MYQFSKPGLGLLVDRIHALIDRLLLLLQDLGIGRLLETIEDLGGSQYVDHVYNQQLWRIWVCITSSSSLVRGEPISRAEEAGRCCSGIHHAVVNLELLPQRAGRGAHDT